MRFRRRSKHHAAVETGALSDILFFLMLFFLIVSTLASPTAIKLLLPKSSTGQTVPKHLINIAVTADSRLYIEQEEIAIATLQSRLEQEKLKHDNPTVVLRCDKSQTVELLVQVVDVINKAKLPLVIATEKAS